MDIIDVKITSSYHIETGFPNFGTKIIEAVHVPECEFYEFLKSISIKYGDELVDDGNMLVSFVSENEVLVEIYNGYRE